MMGRYLLCVWVLLSCGDAAAQSDDLLFLEYASQRRGLDSIVKANSEDTIAVERELSRIEDLAIDEGDDQLETLTRLIRSRYALERKRFSSDLEERTLRIASKEEEYLKADAHQLLADYYWSEKQFTTSLEHHLYAYQVYSEFSAKEFPPKVAYIQACGSRYYYFGDYATAKKYFLEAYSQVDSDEVGISEVNTIALCYDFLGQLDSAMYYYELAMDAAENGQDTIWIAIIQGNMADIFHKKHEYDTAMQLIEQSVETILARKGALRNATYGLAILGDLYLMKGDKKKALELEEQAYQILLQKNKWNSHDVVMRVYPYIAKAYAANGQMDLAYALLDSARIARDSVAEDRNLLHLAGAQHKAEMQRHFLEIEKKESRLKVQTTVRNALIAGFGIVALLSVVLVRQKRRISKEKKRSDNLLLNILPQETADELKSKGSAEARSYDLVTVMFTDFKDFTSTSERMDAKQLVQEIHSYYMEFDRIIDSHNIEKIKTIGDSYMCAGGLPVENKTNAEDVVNAALEIQQFMQRDKEERERRGQHTFQIRIGINSGPVVAGIVGIRKFAYDIWGDTVNIAFRMQSSGEEGKINISGSTYELIKDRFHCTYRGKVAAKNKGEIDMYFVSGPK